MSFGLNSRKNRNCSKLSENWISEVK